VFSFRAQVPSGATASVHVPSRDAGQVRDLDGRGPVAVARFPGAAGVSEAVFEVGPGPTSSPARPCKDLFLPNGPWFQRS
jgi:hypothetical protein